MRAAVSDAPKVAISQKTRNRGEPQASSSGFAMIHSTSMEMKNQKRLAPWTNW